MTLLPLSLGVGRLPDAGGAASKTHQVTRAQIDKALARDAFTCRCCGFSSKKFQTAIPVSQLSKGKSSDQGLATVCSFCELTATLERAGQTAAGYLIWLPEMSQTDLNHAVRALYIARASKNETLSKAASRTLDVLISRRAEVKKRLGTDDPAVLATAMLEQVKAANLDGLQAKLEGIRFLPLDRYFVRVRGKDTNVFDQMVSHWTSSEGAFAKLPVDGWVKMFEDISAKAEA